MPGQFVPWEHGPAMPPIPGSGPRMPPWHQSPQDMVWPPGWPNVQSTSVLVPGVDSSSVSTTYMQTNTAVSSSVESKTSTTQVSNPLSVSQAHAGNTQTTYSTAPSFDLDAIPLPFAPPPPQTSSAQEEVFPPLPPEPFPMPQTSAPPLPVAPPAPLSQTSAPPLPVAPPVPLSQTSAPPLPEAPAAPYPVTGPPQVPLPQTSPSPSIVEAPPVLLPRTSAPPAPVSTPSQMTGPQVVKQQQKENTESKRKAEQSRIAELIQKKLKALQEQKTGPSTPARSFLSKTAKPALPRQQEVKESTVSAAETVPLPQNPVLPAVHFSQHPAPPGVPLPQNPAPPAVHFSQHPVPSAAPLPQNPAPSNVPVLMPHKPVQGDNSAKTSRHLMASGLPQGTKAPEVMALFSQLGKVQNCKVGANKGENSLVALVSMTTASEAEQCIFLLNGSTFKDSKIKVQIHDVTSKRSDSDRKGNSSKGSKNLWVSGLPPGSKAAEIKALLSVHGKVINCKVGANKGQADNSLFAVVAMETAEEAAKCISELDNSTFKGNTISIKKLKSK